MSNPTTRTFSRAAWDEAQALWAAGGFGAEWHDYRHEAAMRGMIYPPSVEGSEYWGDPAASQRALVYREIEDNPTRLHRAIAQGRSWGDVVAYCLRERDERAYESERAERYAASDPDAPTHRDAVQALAAIVRRIGDSI